MNSINQVKFGSKVLYKGCYGYGYRSGCAYNRNSLRHVTNEFGSECVLWLMVGLSNPIQSNLGYLTQAMWRPPIHIHTYIHKEYIDKYINIYKPNKT